MRAAERVPLRRTKTHLRVSSRAQIAPLFGASRNASHAEFWPIRVSRIAVSCAVRRANALLLLFASTRIVTPAVEALNAAGFTAHGIVRHGDVAETLNAITVENGGTQIVVGRASADGFKKRLFGSSTQNLVMHADVPVTVVN